VNKLHEIDSVYRNFELEIIAGEPNTVVHCRESKATFQFDFAKVYWNPRLSKSRKFSFHYELIFIQVLNENVSLKFLLRMILLLMSLLVLDHSLYQLQCLVVQFMLMILILNVLNG
jgi:hypothetical protein